MKKSAFIPLSFLSIVGFNHKTYATHLLGAEITYEVLDSFKFRVHLNYFRFCSGVPMGTPNVTMVCTGSPLLGTVNLSANIGSRSITDITAYCPTAQPLCRNNQSYTGSGIEKHQFKSIEIDWKIYL